MKKSLDILSLDILGVALCLALYLGLAAAQIELPGLYYDEAADAVPAVQILAGQPIDALRGATVSLFGLTLPLMIFDYVGPWNTYLLLPIFQVFGVSVASLRGLTIGAGALTIVLAYLFTREFAGRSVALATTLLLAVSPAFVWWTREGIHVTSILLIFSLGSLILLLRWYRTGAAVPLIGAAWLLGAGLTAKFLFLWWLTALAAAYVLLVWLPPRLARLRGLGAFGQDQGSQGMLATEADEPLTGPDAARPADDRAQPHRLEGRRLAVLAPPEQLAALYLGAPEPGAKARSASPLVSESRRADPRHAGPDTRKSEHGPPNSPLWAWSAAGVAFLLGAGPLVWFNLQTGGTIEVILRNSVNTHLGANNLDLPANLAQVGEHALAAIQGGMFWYFGGTYENRLWPAALALVTAAWIGLLFRRPALRRHWRRPAFLYLMLGCLVFQSAFTVSSLEPTHHLIVWPIPMILVAWGAIELARALGEAVGSRQSGVGKRFGQLGLVVPILPIGIVGVLAAGDLWTDLRYHQALGRSGGLATHSDAIYRLADWLREQPVADPIALDWGIRNSVLVLTEGAVQPVEVFMYDREPPPLFFDWLYGSLTKQPDQLYLLHADQFATFPRRAAFERLAARLGRTVKLEAQFRQRDGTVVYEVYSARPR